MAFSHAALGLAQRFTCFTPRSLERRSQPKYDSSNYRDSEGVHENPPIHSDHFHSWNFSCRRQGQQNGHTPKCNENSANTAHEGKKSAFRKQLAHEPPPSSPQCTPQHHFMSAARRPSQEQIQIG